MGVLLLAAAAGAHARPATGPPPAWVAPVDLPDLHGLEISPQFGASYCLLLDRQWDLASAATYNRVAFKLLNAEGVQQLSDITVSYDPSFEALTLHTARVVRGTKVVDKLASDPIRVMRRETSLERRMYDGSLTVSISLSDVRVGDIVDYSYTRRGRNPAFGTHTFGRVLLEPGVPVEAFHARLIVPDNAGVTLTHQNTDITPVVTRAGGRTAYEWTRRHVEARDIEDDVPAWFFDYASAKFTDFRSWKEVVDWALPYYAVAPDEKERLRALAGDLLVGGAEPASILRVVRFVQDDVRYLAVEGGMSAYRPHAPTQVWKQRYGDCKDKALLLVALLDALGVEAHPMLVNTAALRSAADYVMSPADFDHCVVAIMPGTHVLYVDPTASHQGGDLEHLYFPNFAHGLVVAPGTEALADLPAGDPGSVTVAEHIGLDNQGGAELFVVSEYRGAMADVQREQFALVDLASIQKHYVAFYAGTYPKIKPTAEIRFNDAERDSGNVFTVQEKYQLDDLWSVDMDDTSAKYIRLEPVELAQYTDFKSNGERKMPLAVGRVNQRHEFIVDGGGPWYAEPEHVSVKGDAFRYEKTATVQPGRLHIIHDYQRTASYVESSAVANFVARHDQIRDHLASVIVTPPPAASHPHAAWTAIVMLVVMAGAAVWGSRTIYFNYDPEPRAAAEEVEPRIRGWLLLVAGQLILSAVIIMVTLPTFAENLESAIRSGNLSFLFWFTVVRWAWFVSTLILLLVLFFMRRTCFPRVMVWTAVGNLVFSFLTVEGRPLIAVMSAAIWIPYFLRSRRVARTFVARSPHHSAPAAGEAPEAGPLL